MKFFTRTALAGVLSFGLVAGTATAAFAASDPAPVPASPGEGPLVPTFNQKVRCDRAIQNRINSMNRWTNQVNRRNNLTPDQKAAIVALMSPVSAALSTVTRPALAAATDLTEIKDLCRSIVLTYRVYKVLHPQVFLTAAADAWMNRLETLQAASVTFAGAGKDVTLLNARINAALALVSPVAGAVAAITPESYNADPKGTDKLFRKYRRDLEAARRYIKKAEQQARRIQRTMP